MPAAIPFVVMAVGAAVSAAGTIYSGQQQKKASEYNARVQENQAKAIETQTREAIRRQRIQNEAILGAQRVSALSSGVTETGSVATGLIENSRRLEQNITDIATQGNAQQYAALNSATLSRMQGSAAATGSLISGVGSFVSSAGSAYAGYKGVK